jgi:type II secretory pathway component PulL
MMGLILLLISISGLIGAWHLMAEERRRKERAEREFRRLMGHDPDQANTQAEEKDRSGS